jgi:cytochrome bd-type quinol oxidase subunit 1
MDTYHLRMNIFAAPRTTCELQWPSEYGYLEAIAGFMMGMCRRKIFVVEWDETRQSLSRVVSDMCYLASLILFLFLFLLLLFVFLVLLALLLRDLVLSLALLRALSLRIPCLRCLGHRRS